jgi:hypothetical protein
MQKLTGDKGMVLELPFDFFHLWCCHCHLRHQVYIEKVNSEKVRICMIADLEPTKNVRKFKRFKKKYERIESELKKIRD